MKQTAIKKDLDIMIELQQLWDKVLNSRREIEKGKKAILLGEEKIEKNSRNISATELEIKQQKVFLDEKEIELTLKDEHAKKLEASKAIITTEKELTALENELGRINTERGEIEEELILAIDELSEKEKKFLQAKSQFEELTHHVVSDNNNLKEKIEQAVAIESSNTSDFDKLITDLSESCRAKFLERLNSPGGKAIASIENQTCGVCHCAIPIHLAKDAGNENKIHLCPNCSGFIYRKT